MSEVATIDRCEWGKVHPSMFPPAFDLRTHITDPSDTTDLEGKYGWTLLVDKRTFSASHIKVNTTYIYFIIYRLIS